MRGIPLTAELAAEMTHPMTDEEFGRLTSQGRLSPEELFRVRVYLTHRAADCFAWHLSRFNLKVSRQIVQRRPDGNYRLLVCGKVLRLIGREDLVARATMLLSAIHEARKARPKVRVRELVRCLWENAVMKYPSLAEFPGPA